MWKRGGQSSALNRAQALLAAKKNSRGVGQSTQASPAKAQDTGDGLINTRPAPPSTHTLFSDLSDLSSLSSAPEHGTNPTNCTAPEKNQVRKDIRPQSSLEGGGSKFLKKASPHVTNSSQSSVSRSPMKQIPEPRYVPSSQHGSQAAVLSRLAEIESCVYSCTQSHEQTRELPQPYHDVIPNLATPQEAVTQTLEASKPLASAQSRNDQLQKVKCFLKNKVATSESTVGPGVRARSRAAASAFLLGGLETNPVKVDYGVSLESDEEDMRKLLGELTDNCFIRPEKSSSVIKTEKMLNHSTPPSAAVQHLSSNTAPPPCPASPSHRSSPFRFTGQAQAHFSPSSFSQCLSPPCVSPSHSRSTPCGVRNHSMCSVSDHREVLSLEDLFPVEPASDDLHSVISLVSSEDFKLNVMTLDELVPATTGFTEKTPRKQREEHYLPVSPERHEKRYKEAKQQQHKDKKEEDMLDYQSDFESESQTEQNYSASQVSEQLMGNGDEEEATSEDRDEALVSDMFQGRTEDDYSNIFSDPIHLCMSQTSDYSYASESLSRSRDSRSPVTHVKQTAARRVVKEAAVQTQLATYMWPTGLTYMNPTSVAAHSLGTETVEALSTYNPAVFVLNEMLKHQLATTRQFIESSHHLHTSLVRSLEPPNYRYTTLEETKEYIRMHRSPKLTMEEALKEAMQEIKEYHRTVCD